MPDSCPIWDLDDLYSGITDVKLASDVVSCRKAAAALQDRWQGKLAKASADELVSSLVNMNICLNSLAVCKVMPNCCLPLIQQSLKSPNIINRCVKLARKFMQKFFSLSLKLPVLTNPM